MKRILISLVFMLFITQLYSATIRVTSPGNGNQWCRGTMNTIRWLTSGSMDSKVKIRLYRGEQMVLRIVTNTENDGEYQWNIPSNLGEAVYQIRVRTMDSQVYDDSDEFTIKACLQAHTAPTLPPTKPPALTKLMIDNGADSTQQVQVTLNHELSRIPGISGTPSHYRARNMLTSSAWSSWKHYEKAPRWNLLPDICGMQKVFFQLKNQYGESNVVADIISYTGRKIEYTVPIGDVMNLAEKYGFSHSAIPLDPNCKYCDVSYVTTGPPDIRPVFMTVVQKNTALRAKGECVIFAGGRLNPGWEFVAFGEIHSVPIDSCYQLVSWPERGSRDITLKARVWRNGRPDPIHPLVGKISNAVFPPSTNLGSSNWLQINTITLKGPCSLSWKEAFIK